ncbi:MAG: InlB B-repeat-containing protein [Lachnospiraceae bacterium]|nr:InlB B-repeat-containing protein [Lachnospiraceae bacterium]
MKKKLFILGVMVLSYVLIITDSIYAKNSKDNIETEITYELYGGYNSILNPVNISAKQLPISLENPRKSGYSFGGWYMEESFEHRVYNVTDVSMNHLYAKWNLNINPNQNVQDYPYKNIGTEIPLKELSYDFLYAIDTPGNPKTRVEDLLEKKFSSEFQCPQGLCITPEYYIVSSYAMENDKQGALTLYRRDNGEYVVSLGMEAESHLGGVAFDGKNLWICHSKTNEIECISYDFVEEIAGLSNQNFIDISNCFTKYKVNNIPSCITCFENKLYVVTHRVYTPGVLYCYELIDNTLQLKEKLLLPSKVQGIYFDEKGGVWLSQSYGRNRSSHILYYSNITSLKKEFMIPEISVEMPPGSEAIVVEDNICYVLFETASYKYYEGGDGKGACKYPLDRILMVNCDSIFFD